MFHIVMQFINFKYSWTSSRAEFNERPHAIGPIDAWPRQDRTTLAAVYNKRLCTREHLPPTHGIINHTRWGWGRDYTIIEYCTVSQHGDSCVGWLAGWCWNTAKVIQQLKVFSVCLRHSLWLITVEYDTLMPTEQRSASISGLWASAFSR